MANGRQAAEDNVRKFKDWTASMTDADFREMEFRGSLKRGSVAKGCSFSKSVLQQNPVVKALLTELEDGLRERNVLPPLTNKPNQSLDKPKELDQNIAKLNKQSLHTRRLEQRIVELEARNADLEVKNTELERKLDRLQSLSSALADVGRLPK